MADFKDPDAWHQAIIQHVLDSGHTGLQPIEDYKRAMTGVVCPEPACQLVWYTPGSGLGWNDGPIATILRSYLKSGTGQLAIVKALVQIGLQRRAQKPLEPKTIWSRLLDEDPFDPK